MVHGSIMWLETRRRPTDLPTHTHTHMLTQSNCTKLQPPLPHSDLVEQARLCRWFCSFIVNNRLGMLASCRQKQLRIFQGKHPPVHCRNVQRSIILNEANKVPSASLLPSQALITSSCSSKPNRMLNELPPLTQCVYHLFLHSLVRVC